MVLVCHNTRQTRRGFIMIAITGATGQLGQLVIEQLLNTVPANQIVAIVRNPAKAEALSQQGITVRQGDYADESTMTSALKGIDKLLLISSSEVGQRATQHQNVINAAKAAGVKFIAYTSLLHADKSPLGLHVEHVATEKALAESGIPYALLRNGWYTENYLASAPPALEHGVFIGAAGEGKIASATRADYAAAAAKVISGDGHAGNVYELAGDHAWTLSELAAELSKQSGKNVTYQNMSEADFAAALKGVGLPAGLADMLADSDVGASKGGLFDDSHTLSKLIGRPTTPLSESIKAIL
ncbi:Quinone oxidoreductase 2 [Enterobacter ludwigii]|uniref:Quinone oxidoreductase 2 n=2 Tax=Enterobacter ludwigii TaxID=299767 RepID=G8LJB2_9ENTR|nr:Quinone oxidoreductase 2 [Enterobacter ludwigii]